MRNRQRSHRGCPIASKALIRPVWRCCEMLRGSYPRAMDVLALIFSALAVVVAGRALWLSHRQDKRSLEIHDVEWRAPWMMGSLWPKNHGTVSAHDVKFVVEYGEDDRIVVQDPMVSGGSPREIRLKDFSSRRRVHWKAGGKDYTEEAVVRITWRTALGTPKAQTVKVTLD